MQSMQWRSMTLAAVSIGIAGAAWPSASALATDVIITNPGFEDISGENPFNEFTFGPLNGWDLYDPGGIADGGDGPTFYIGTLTPFETDPVNDPGVYTNFPDGAAEGIRVAIAFNFFGSGDSGEYGLQQTLSEVLRPDSTYTLEVEIGNIATGTAMSGELFVLDGFPGYRVELLAGGVLIGVDDNTLAGAIPDGEFATSTISVTVGRDHPQLGQTLSIRLINLNQTDPAFPKSHLEVDFDDVRMTVETAAPCLGDVVESGVIDTEDLLALLSCWAPGGPVAPECMAADLDGNDSVDVADLLMLLSAWGECP